MLAWTAEGGCPHVNRKGRRTTALMANTSTLSKEERKKTKRAARKKRKAEKPLKPREYARGSQKRKVKKLARGQSKR
jgi:thiamine kinase-like enzyme